MAFLYFNLPLAKLRLKHFLYRSLLTTSFHLKFSLPQNLFHLAISSIYRRSRLLLSSSVGCCCFIFIPHIQQIIAWSLILVCEKSVDMGHVSLQASKNCGPDWEHVRIGAQTLLSSPQYWVLGYVMLCHIVFRYFVTVLFGIIFMREKAPLIEYLFQFFTCL